VILTVARADFLERVRRHSFLVTLLFAVYLGYATAKGQISLQLDEYRGVYTSAWIGTLVALVTACFVSLVGFYIVKNSVQRDRSTGVGQILAATPIAKSAYAFGKFLSNFMVLASMVVVLALGAVTMQFLVAEDPRVDFWALLAPFLFIALPVMALTASIAILFEMTPGLKRGVGNVIWFFAWSFGTALPLITGLKWLDPSGIVTVMQSLSEEARRYVPNYHGGMAFQINLGQIHVAPDLRWLGLMWNWHAILLRLMWFAVACGLALFASVMFDRFASTQVTRPPRKRMARDNSQGVQAEAVPVPVSTTVHLTPLAASPRSTAFRRIFFAELRLALQGLRWWWYVIAAGLLIAQLAAPLEISRGPLLGIAWIWPVLIWSAMGARETRFGMRHLVFSCANILPRQLLACWLAGVAITLLTGAGAAVRLVLAGQLPGVLAIVVATLFIPALALSLGVLTGSGKFFEALYTVLWYVGPMNRTPGLDFTGAAGGLQLSRYALFYFSLSAALLVAALFVRSRQLRDA
jgi:hypothetical protein